MFNIIQNSFVRLYCDCVISARVFNKTSKLANFCVAILIFKMEEKQHFWHTMLYYFKKGKNAIEKQKICSVYGDHAMTDQMCFILDISH